MKLLNDSSYKNEENEEETQIKHDNKLNENLPETSLDNLLNNITYKKERTNIFKRQTKNKIEINSNKIEPLNKESYNRILNEERLHQRLYQNEIEDYESKYRGTSLLEIHQEKLAKEKQEKKSSNDIIMRNFDREKVLNVGRVDSKRALGIMQDKQGLKGRFEQKEKYVGY